MANRPPPSAQPPTTLPIIDISPFISPDSTPQSRKDTAKALNSACLDYGFFYLAGHGIPDSMLDKVLSLARDFFSLPQEQKKKIQRYDAGGPEGGDGARGYQGMGENVTMGRRDMHEAIDWYREWDSNTDSKEETDRKGKPVKVLQGPNLWPEEPVELKPVYLQYIESLKKVGEAVVRAMGVALDLGSPSSDADSEAEDEEIFVRATKDSFWVMRMIGYPPLASAPNSSSEELSCGQHTDYGCLTLLHADPTPGALQVLLRDGKTWLTADPLPGVFVVNIGDMMERWTNGMWKSTVHRVIHRGEGYRVSAPFFFEPGWDVVVKPLRKCVEATGGKALWGERKYGEHLLEKVGGNFYAAGGEG
jgi:isopenicillin N synthase-like dioxygenase